MQELQIESPKSEKISEEFLARQRIVAVIPARAGSERLSRKNTHPIWGKPMLYWAIRACLHSQHIRHVYVSTEDAGIGRMAKEYGARFIARPDELARSDVFKQEVIVHAAKSMRQVLDGWTCDWRVPDIVVSVQPNSPEIDPVDLDAAIKKLYAHDRNEIFSVNEDLIQNAAFRVMRYHYVFQQSLSTKCGVYVTHYADIHTLEDVQYVEKHRRFASCNDEPIK